MSVRPENAQKFTAVWMEVYSKNGTAKDVSSILKIDHRDMMRRRRATEDFLGKRLPSLGAGNLSSMSLSTPRTSLYQER